MPLSRAEVIKKCEQLLTSFNPIITTVDCYAAEKLGPDCEGMVGQGFVHYVLSTGLDHER